MKTVVVETTVVRYFIEIPGATTPAECEREARRRFCESTDPTEFEHEVLENSIRSRIKRGLQPRSLPRSLH